MNKKFTLYIVLAMSFNKANAQQEEKTIEEITIASKVPQKINKTGRNTILLTEEDLKKYSGKTLSDVLIQVSGFQITGNYTNNQEPKTLRVRGGNNANVIILIDGIPLQDVTDASSILTDIRLLSLDNIGSIEILNGASSVLYGSNSTTTVIDIKTKKYSNKKLEATVGVRVGSYETYAQKFGISGKSGIFNYQISGINEKSDGISSAQGNNTFDKDGFEKQNIDIKLGTELKNFNFNILGGWNHLLYDYDYGAFSDGKLRGNNKQTFIGSNAEYSYNIGKIIFNTRYTENKRIYEDFKYSEYEEQSIYKGFNYFSELYNNLKLREYINLITGVQYESQKMDYKDLIWGGNLDQQKTTISHIDAFANAYFKYKFFNLDAGVRMTNNSKFGTHWVYNINPYFYQEFNNWFGKLGYTFGTAFIIPTLYQTYGDGNITKPNFDLSPETNESQEFNLSLGKQDRSFVLNISLFQRNEKNTIGYQTISYLPYEGKYINLYENKVKGIEVNIDYKVIPFLNIGGNFSFVEKDHEAAMVHQPKQRINSYITVYPFKGNSIYLSHTYVSKRSRSIYDNLSYSMDDFNLFDIGINQQINNINIYFHLNNIFNKKYIDIIGYTTKNRNFTFGVNYKF